MSKSSQTPSEKDLKKLIRYQYAKVRNTSDSISRADEVRKLKALVSEMDFGVKNMKFSVEQADAAEFLLPLIKELYQENSLSLHSTLTPFNNKALAPSLKTDPANSLEVPMAGASKRPERISELLANYQKPENLSEDNSFEFEARDGKSPSKKSQTTKSLSVAVNANTREFALSVKRFEYDMQTNTKNKINGEVILDEITLNIANPQDATTQRTFVPTAFVLHYGSLSGGHYTAYVKETGGWFLYNDELKSGPVTEEQALEEGRKRAYIIKYSDKASPNLPQPQNPSKNLGNTCWANSALAFAGSFRTFDYCKDISLTSDEKALYNDITKTVPTPAKPIKKAAAPSSKTYEKSIEELQACFKSFGSQEDSNHLSYYQNDGTKVSYFLENKSPRRTLLKPGAPGIFDTVYKVTYPETGREEQCLSLEDLGEEIEKVKEFALESTPKAPPQNKTVSSLPNPTNSSSKPLATKSKAPVLKDKTTAKGPKKTLRWEKAESLVNTLKSEAEEFFQPLTHAISPTKKSTKLKETPKELTKKVSHETLYEAVGRKSKNSFTAMDAAEIRLKELNLTKMTGDLRKSILELTAKGIETKASQAASTNTKIKGKFVSNNYQRHVRSDFENIDFSASFMNSFANCKFSGTCKFNNADRNKNKFVNCVFDKTLAPEQAKEILKIDPKNLINCKFDKAFIEKLGDSNKQRDFKKSLGLNDKANSAGFYEKIQPSKIPKPLTAFQLKTPVQSRTFS